MDEPDLRLFLSLCDTENTRDTAALLRVNQSNVSRALGRLESELGVALFARHGRRLELNRAGAAFRTDAARLVDDYEAARRHLAQQVGRESVIRIGFLQSTARWMLARAIGGYRGVAPDSRFELRQGFSYDLFGWIDDDLLDVALVTPPPPHRRGIDWELMTEQQLVVAVPPGHRLATRPSVSVADLDGESFIAFSRATELRGVIDSLLQADEVGVRIAFESSEIDTIRGLVAVGLGISIVPRPALTDASDPLYLALDPGRVRPLGLAWSAGRQQPDSVAGFLTHWRSAPW